MPDNNFVTTQQDTDGSRDWFVRDVPLGGSPLAQALQADPQLHGWLAARPMDAEAWRARVADLQAQSRSKDWLAPLAPAFAATGHAAERLGQAASHGLVVTTGQQPGLFGGPTYTWSKALSALAMADTLQELTGVPVAPVFWAATDDADWLEAAVTYLASSAGLERVALNGPATDGIAMSDVPLGDLDAALRALRSSCGSLVHPDVVSLVEHAYVAHATIGAAYVHLLRGLLEPLGIAVLDASHPALRAATDPVLRQALRHAPAIAAALASRSNAIVAAGFKPQVDVIDDLSLVFHTQTSTTGSRDRVRTRVPVADAQRVMREADVGTLGANVLLRPVVERALLPTVAYHAGPGELSYFAQVAPIATAMEHAIPLPVPRWSGEVIDQRAVELRDALGLDDDMLRDPYAAETFVARQSVTVDVQDAMERLRLAIETQVRAVGESVHRADDVIDAHVVDGLGKQLARRLERFERRVVAGAKRREETLMRQVARVRAALRPEGQSPERVLNLIPLLARFGPSVMLTMREHAQAYVRRIVIGR